MGVSDLARLLDLNRATTHRYVATLASLGYLQQDASTRKYRLGPKVVDLGLAALNSMELREIAVPHLQKLSDETGYTVNMAILDGPEVVYVERVRTSRPGQSAIDLNLHVGSRLPAYCTSMGKVLLAYLEPDAQKAVLEAVKFVKLGPNTITSRSALLQELRQVREAGLAVSSEEMAVGLRSIATPIHSRNGKVVAAINIATHRTMVSIAELTRSLGPKLIRTAATISSQIA
jgi:IclR family transcriptional regulator, pca regulon regulatory protein